MTETEKFVAEAVYEAIERKDSMRALFKKSSDKGKRFTFEIDGAFVTLRKSYKTKTGALSGLRAWALRVVNAT